MRDFNPTRSAWIPTGPTGVLMESVLISTHGIRVDPDEGLPVTDSQLWISTHGIRMDPDRNIVLSLQ